jgi:hypothetical protein
VRRPGGLGGQERLDVDVADAHGRPVGDAAILVEEDGQVTDRGEVGFYGGVLEGPGARPLRTRRGW